MNKFLVEAIEHTIELHQKVISGDSENYTSARFEHNNGECPLCEYAMRASEGDYDANYCNHCPWKTIQDPDSVLDEPCDHPELSLLNPEQSIARLNSWLREEVYEEGFSSLMFFPTKPPLLLCFLCTEKCR